MLMNNEEFQKAVLHELRSLRTDVNEIKVEQKNMSTRQDEMSVRQDEIYQVVRAIEHSNVVGKSELDGQNIRLAKIEGIQNRVAKAYNEEIAIEMVST